MLSCSRLLTAGLSVLLCIAMLLPAAAEPIAKKLFGGRKLPAVMKPAVHGFYSKGCVQGAVAIPADGPTWQAMRLERNRRWGHPETIKTVIKLSQDGRKVGWNGLLVGDISQPRGGPMLTGHASHQLGLDADIWLTPMPKKRFTRAQRSTVSATSMLKRKKSRKGKWYFDQNTINSKVFSNAHYGLIKTAAQYPEVQRILVHPTIKKELCRRARGTDTRWLHKVRPYWRHHYHMHVRLRCPEGSPNCRPQATPKANDGCGGELKMWHKLLNPKPRKKPKKKPGQQAKKKKPKKARKPKRQIRMADLPTACRTVLDAWEPANEQAAEVQLAGGRAVVPQMKAVRAPTTGSTESYTLPIELKIPKPKFRPKG